jgi:hypothetical protein
MTTAQHRDSEAAGRALALARWESPEWIERRSMARCRKIKQMLARSPITPQEAAELRALLPPVDGSDS